MKPAFKLMGALLSAILTRPNIAISSPHNPTPPYVKARPGPGDATWTAATVIGKQPPRATAVAVVKTPVWNLELRTYTVYICCLLKFNFKAESPWQHKSKTDGAL